MWPVKTRTRIFLPFFDWYGGEGSGSHRKIIIQEPQQTTGLKGVGIVNNDNLLGKGRFSRVIRCKIKEESRICQKATTKSLDTSSCITENKDTTDSVEDKEFSPEMAIKVRFLG